MTIWRDRSLSFGRVIYGWQNNLRMNFYNFVKIITFFKKIQRLKTEMVIWLAAMIKILGLSMQKSERPKVTPYILQL